MAASEVEHGQGGFRIRPARADEAQPFRMLLPTVGEFSVGLVAISTTDERVIGAAAISKSMRPRPPVGPGIAVHVIPPWRRRGIGGALLDELKQAAQGSSAEAFYAMQKVAADSDEEQGWRWLGFQPFETVIYHELPLAAIESRLAPLHDWMSTKQAIPTAAEIIALCDADHAAIADLHIEVMGGDRRMLLSKMRGERLGAYHPRYSRVLLLGGAVKGFILAHRESKEVAVVDANILAPDVRGGWANLWLKLEATRGAAELGIERFIYNTFDHYADTRAFSEMLGGVETRRLLLMHYPLEDSNGDSADDGE